ncbi:hypothetical protein B0O99DRAFT_721216 [Bisporella sp. PMI_857]|nr:hypothetical protein B0O99DRAFT_721216 [Bisporella sp. PMI_857]
MGDFVPLEENLNLSDGEVVASPLENQIHKTLSFISAHIQNPGSPKFTRKFPKDMRKRYEILADLSRLLARKNEVISVIQEGPYDFIIIETGVKNASQRSKDIDVPFEFYILAALIHLKEAYSAVKQAQRTSAFDRFIKIVMLSNIENILRKVDDYVQGEDLLLDQRRLILKSALITVKYLKVRQVIRANARSRPGYLHQNIFNEANSTETDEEDMLQEFLESYNDLHTFLHLFSKETSTMLKAIAIISLRRGRAFEHAQADRPEAISAQMFPRWSERGESFGEFTRDMNVATHGIDAQSSAWATAAHNYLIACVQHITYINRLRNYCKRHFKYYQFMSKVNIKTIVAETTPYERLQGEKMSVGEHDKQTSEIRHYRRTLRGIIQQMQGTCVIPFLDDTE